MSSIWQTLLKNESCVNAIHVQCMRFLLLFDNFDSEKWLCFCKKRLILPFFCSIKEIFL